MTSNETSAPGAKPRRTSPPRRDRRTPWKGGRVRVFISYSRDDLAVVGELEGERPRYVEIGWGDVDYYRDPEPGLGTLLRAALIPTAGTVQIVPVWTSVERFARGADLYGYIVPDSLRTPLLAYLMAEIALEDGEVVDQGPSLYGSGRFFAATRRYHMFHNSNHWAARALHTAGCDLSVWQSLIIELLFIQLSECGFEIESTE